jgi:hypothetical protein
MKAEPVIHVKHFFDDGSIVEMVIWRLPKADHERPHALKYRLYFGKTAFGGFQSRYRQHQSQRR